MEVQGETNRAGFKVSLNKKGNYILLMNYLKGEGEI